MMEPLIRVDLRKSSFSEFIAFLFSHEVPPKSEEFDAWYCHVEVEFEAEMICTCYVQLFRNPEFLLTEFTKPQLEQGFWAIQSPNLDCGLPNLLSEVDLSTNAREECIRSMVDLFRRLFAIEPLDTSVHMWWDSLCYDWHCGNRNRERGGEDQLMQDALFQALAKILFLDSETCQGAALHGLGHLHHPDTQELIEHYVETNPSLAEDWKTYARAAARFEVL